MTVSVTLNLSSQPSELRKLSILNSLGNSPLFSSTLWQDVVLSCLAFKRHVPACIYLLKVNNRNTGTLETLASLYFIPCSSVSIVNFEQVIADFSVTGIINTVKPAQTTTSIRQPVLSPPKQIPIQSLLYKTTTCLTRPATTYFVPQMKKNLSKTATAKFYPAEKWVAMHKK